MSTSNMSRPGPISQQSRMSLSSHWPSAPAQAKIRTYDLSRTKSYMFVELSWSRLQQQEVMWGHWISKGKQSQIELKALRCPLQKVNHVNTYKYRFSSQSKDIKIFPADKNSAMQVKSVHICGKGSNLSDYCCPTNRRNHRDAAQLWRSGCSCPNRQECRCPTHEAAAALVAGSCPGVGLVLIIRTNV